VFVCQGIPKDKEKPDASVTLFTTWREFVCNWSMVHSYVERFGIWNVFLIERPFIST